MATYNIEFAHIYLNQNIGEEHRRSALVMRAFADEIRRKNGTFTSVVLIDDYNATEKVLDVQELPSLLEKEGAKPDLMAYEAALAEGAENLLSVSKGYEMKSSMQYYRTNGKLPCSLLVATWYLVRLGAIDPPKNLLVEGGESTINPSDKLINILPDYYEKIEKRALTLLQNSPYAHLLDKIHNHYFPS